MSDLDRRTFVRDAALTASAAFGVPLVASASDASLARAARARRIAAGAAPGLRLGVVGCGGRGTGAVANALEASEDCRLHAMGDLFPDRLAGSRERLAGRGERAQVPDARAFTGFDAIDQVLGTGVDVIILATPPHFRPAHFAKAVDAGVHVFMEKPVAVDPAGVRTVIAAADRARAANLSVVAGTQRRHEKCYLQAMDHVRRGRIGRIVSCSAYWNQGGLWMKPRQSDWTDMEWQLRNWLYFTWLSGDHIVEQHVHNLDACLWALGERPTACTGLGGRQVRTAPEYGHVFDHFAIEYEFASGATMTSLCRQIDGTTPRVEEVMRGTEGTLRTTSGRAEIDGAYPWWFEGQNPNPYVQEHRDLHESIRTNAALNEGRQIAESTLTAIMGRMSAYTGKRVTWEQALESSLDLAPSAYAFGPMDVPPVAVPGRTPLV